MIIISLEIEYFEYYYLFPLLKEILNYQGYTLNLKNLTQQTVKNTSQLTKWLFFFHKNYNKIYFNNSFFRNNLKNKNEKYTFYFQLEKKKNFSFVLKLILYYKKWKADELYMKMAYIAYYENLIEFSITFFKMARFEKQTFFLFLF